MLDLHIPTLFTTICVASLVCALVMYINWRINSGVQGIKQWMLGAFSYCTAFLISITFPMMSISPDIRITLNNTFTLTALLCIIEGCLRFKGYRSEHRWKWAFVAIPIFFTMSWINSDQTVPRHLFHDSIAIISLLAVSVIMMYGARSRDQLMVYGMFALFSTALAFAFVSRWLSVWGLDFDTPSNAIPTNIPVMIGLMLYTVGWTFSITVACYYRATQTVRQMALEDSLTGLPNRRALDDQLASICRQAERYGQGFAIIALDLDGFKRVNDELGHQAGDDLLREVASRLRRYVRQSDFAGRLGGDEFLIILRNVRTREEAQRSLERLLSELQGGTEGESGRLAVGISAGLALSPEDGTTPYQLLRKADKRMYVDKAASGQQSTDAEHPIGHGLRQDSRMAFD